MKTARDILREHEKDNNGGLTSWQENWIVDAMEDYTEHLLGNERLKSQMNIQSLLDEIVMLKQKHRRDIEEKDFVIKMDRGTIEGYKEMLNNAEQK